jgi:alcohol dehydrogenase class IV
MEDFVYTATARRVIFGHGTSSKVREELERQNLSAALVLSTPQQIGQARTIHEFLGNRAVGIFSGATMHTPTDVTEEAIHVVENLKVDSIVSIGGGSTIGLGKAIAYRSGLPHICIPTTYAGSEMTSILGETANGVKTTKKDPKILPGTVIYDVDHTLSLSPEMSATSGLNAIAHAAEALYAPDTNPIVNLISKEGIRALSVGLVNIMHSSRDREARSLALYGAWLCGMSLESTAMSLHHKLCHTLGGSFNLPHAEVHAALLPHTLAYNSSAAPKAMGDLAEVLPEAEGDAIKGIERLLDRLEIKRALSVYGMRESDIPKAAAIAVTSQYSNPRAIDEESISKLLQHAWYGRPASREI